MSFPEPKNIFDEFHNPLQHKAFKFGIERTQLKFINEGWRPVPSVEWFENWFEDNGFDRFTLKETMTELRQAILSRRIEE